MTPGARIAAAAGVLDTILEDRPAEQALTRWARGARYAGSKDRAAVRDHVFQALRCLRSYACLGGARTGRGLMIGALRAQGVEPGSLFTGEGHAPAPLSPEEQAAGAAPTEEGDRLDLPDWLVAEFRSSLGERAEAAALALKQRAPVMLRVNSHNKSIAQAIEILKEGEIVATPAPIAETALMVQEGARRVAASRAYREGIVELQDGSSQAAMACLHLSEGARVLDYCAGGGGKVLALAARGQGSWFAHDDDTSRMKDLPARAGRAGVRIVTLGPGEAAQQAPYDLVLCDVPCSGSGTWRRAPDAKWRLTPERLDALCATQVRILEEAAGLVRPGGTLVYTTCSVLRQENETVIACFTGVNDMWSTEDQLRWPIGPEGDGFFLARLKKIT